MSSSTFHRGTSLAFLAVVSGTTNLEAQSPPLLRELHRVLPIHIEPRLLGDLDGDGDLDVPIVAYPGPVATLRNDGDGGFALPDTNTYYAFGASDQLLSDIDGDGDIDLMLHFRVPDIVARGAINASSTELRLTGTTFDGRQIEGRDSVRIVPPR